MQKKYVLSLLMAAPAAIPALAAIDAGSVPVETGKWQLQDVTGSLEINNGLINAPMGGTITHTFSREFPKGTYKLTIANGTNIKVSVNNADATIIDETTGEYSFELLKAGGIELKITSKDKIGGSFSLGLITLELDFDFEEAKKALLEKLNAIGAIETLSDPNADTEGRDKLIERKDALQAKIEKLGTSEDLINEYDELEFDEPENTIAKDIRTLSDDVTTFNDATKAANEKYDIAKHNSDKKKIRVNQLESAKAALLKVTTELDKYDADNYVNKLNRKAANDIQKHIDDYQTYLDETFDNRTDKISDDEFAKTSIHEQKNNPYNEAIALYNTVMADIADYEAYTQFVKDVENLDKALAQTVAFINTLVPENGADVFAKRRKEWTEAANAIVTEAKTNLQIDKITDETREYLGAAGFLPEDQQIIQRAIAELTQAKINDQAEFDAVYNVYTTALGVITNLQTEKTDAVNAITNIPEDYKAKFNAHVTAINTEITGLENDIDTAYKEDKLTAETYSEKADEIRTDIAALSAIANLYANIYAQQDRLNTAMEKIAEMDKDDDKKFIETCFTPNKTTIDNAIALLLNDVAALDANNEFTTGCNAINSGVQEVAKNITYLETESKKLSDAVAAVNENLKEYNNAINSVDDLKGSQTVLDEETGKPDDNARDDEWKKFVEENTEYNTAKATLSDYETRLNNAKENTGDPNKCFDAITDLADEMSSGLDGYKATCQQLTFTYCSMVVNDNMGIANDKYTALEETVNDGFTGSSDVDMAGLMNTKTDIQTDIDTKVVADNTDLAEECPGINTRIEEFIKSLADEQTKADEAVRSDKNYKDLQSDPLLSPDGGSVLAAINAAEKANDDNSNKTGDIVNDPAHKIFEGEIGSVKQKLETIKSKIEDAYKATELATDEAKNGFVTSLRNLENDAKKLKEEIENNANNLTSALAKGQSTTDEISSIIKYIANCPENGATEVTAAITEYSALLNDLLNQAYDINTQVVTSYGIAEMRGTAAEDATYNQYIESYQKLLDQAEQYHIDFDNKFLEGAVAHNDALKSAWESQYNALKKVYETDVRAFHDYDGISHTDYRKEIDPLLVKYTHEGIFKYYKEIEDLNKEVSGWFRKKNGLDSGNEPQVAVPVSEQDLELLAFYDRALEIKTEMDKVSAELKTNVDAAADNYYKNTSTTLKNGIDGPDGAKQKLTDAGITDPDAINAAVGAAEKALVDAEEMYTDELDLPVTAPEGSDETVRLQNLGVTMDDIAFILDGAKVDDSNLLIGATAQLKKDIADARAEIDKLDGRLDKAENALPEIKTDAEQAIADATEKIDKLAEKKIEDLADYKPLSERLDQIITKAKDAVEAAETSHEKQSKDTEFNSAVNALNESLTEFNRYIADLAGDNTPSVDAIEAAIKKVNENHAEFKEDKADAAAVQAAIDDANQAVKDAYRDACNREKAVITEQLKRVKLAFNEAVANGSVPQAPAGYDGTGADYYNEQIIEQEKALNAYAYDDAKDKETNKSELTRIENTLNKIESELDEQAVKNAVDVLNDKAAELTGIIEGYETEYNDLEDKTKAEYSEPYDEFRKALEKLQEAWSNGNGVLTMKDNYSRQIDDITAAVNAKYDEIVKRNDEVVAEQEKIAANDARYMTLDKELTDMVQRLVGVADLVDQYKLTEMFKNRLGNLSADLEHYRSDLNNANAAQSLTAETELWNSTAFENSCRDIENSATNTYLDAAISTADRNIAAAFEALTPEPGKRILPETRSKIEEQLKGLTTELGTVRNGKDNTYRNNVDEDADFDYAAYLAKLKKYVDEAERIAKDANDCKATATASTFKAGDIDMDNVVDINDVQTILNWVGSNTTYDEVKNNPEYGDDSPRMAIAADIDENQRLNIGDATAVVSISLGDDASMVRFAMRGKSAETAGCIFAELVSEENGVRRYAINMVNSETLVAGQFDIVLPIGMEIVESNIGERASGHNLMVFDNGDSTRILVASLENAAISGENGAIAYIDVTGSGNLKIENAIFADRQARTYTMSRGDSSFIDTIRTSLTNAKERIYNAAGQALNRVQRGINIIRKSDGSTSKELRR